MLTRIKLIVGCSLALPFIASNAYSQESLPSTSSEWNQKGAASITERTVTATISFLASDELAGRATASPEFNIAAAYVASRFRGAGLEGGAAEGSFYHETNKRMVQTPNAPITFSTERGQLNHFGLLFGGDTPFNYSGEITKIDLGNDPPESGLNGVIGGIYVGDARGQRLVAQVSRISNKLEAAGAKALLLAVPPDCDLIRTAQQYRDKPRPESTQNRLGIPVLLVAEQSLVGEPIHLDVPASIATNSAMRNVIGVLKGSDPELSKEAILFSAHLDHLGARAGEGDTIFNGADDDASGVTAVLMLADAFSVVPRPKRTLLFMTFWGEESGLLGSKQFVMTPTWPLEKIVANVNIEMIGRPEPGAQGKIWMTGWNESNLGVLMNEASKAEGIDIFEHPQFSARLYRQSDNWSFVEKGVIAHSFSAGSLHADYHQVDDEWDRLEIPHMTRVIQGLFYGVQPLTQGAVTPSKPKSK